MLDAERVRVFYLATSPDLYGPICRNIGAHGLVTEQSRVVLEKPIGHDLASAREINDQVGAVFSETQTFRIDHYLGKETVQNLLALRFANTIFERLWNADVIDHVQITVAETVGVEQRGGYYDHSGALRDMVQNHMLQLLCLVAMEPPVSLEADRVRDEKLKVLRALRPFEPHEALTPDGARPVHPGRDRRPAGARLHRRPQRSGEQPDRDLRRAEGGCAHLALGERAVLPAHRQAAAAEGVGDRHPVSRAAVLDLPARRRRMDAEQADHPAAAGRGHAAGDDDQGPGPGGLRLSPTALDIRFEKTFGIRFPDAYERLLMDTVRGNATLFMRRDEVEAAWGWVEPILEAWSSRPDQPRPYSAGTWGPTAAIALIERDGRTWHEEIG